MTQAKEVLASYEQYLRSLGQLSSSDMKEALRINPVYFDFCTESQGVLPWEDSGKYVPLYLMCGKTLKNHFSQSFKHENRDATKTIC